MKLSLRDFRAFQDTGLIEIRPLTFLVGENSSGKTSLLAALNFIWRLQDRVTAATFNNPPFDLGTFDEIVHRVRGRTKPDCFELLVEEVITIDTSNSPYFPVFQGKSERITGKSILKLRFVDNVGDSAISNVNFKFHGYEVRVNVIETVQISIINDKGSVLFDSTRGQANLDFGRRIGRIERLTIGELILYLRRLVIEKSVGPHQKVDMGDFALGLTTSALEQLTRTFPPSVLASAPVRSNPSRVYTPVDQTRTPEGTHTPQRLFKIKESDQARWERIKTGLEDFGKSSGMFTAINVARYRSSGSSPFHINVTRRGKQSNIVDVGYGVSQALPILTDLIEAPPRSGFLFQQPEVHLHPQAQAALGSYFVRYIADHTRSTIVAETHSDYLIDRVRLCVRNGQIKSKDVSILYFESRGTSTEIYQIEIDDQGNIVKSPAGYREFFIREQMNLLGISD